MKKKRYATIVIILMIAIIAVYSTIIVLINTNKEKLPILQQNQSDLNNDENTVKETEYESNYFYTLYPKNMDEALKKYTGPVDYGMIGRYMYRFITNDLKTIYKDTMHMSLGEIKKRYQDDPVTPETMNIYTQEDYVGIAKALQRAGNDDGTYVYKLAEVNLDTCENLEDRYTFIINVKYENNKSISFRMNLSNKENKIEFRKYSEFDSVFELYNGEVKEEDFLDQLSKLTNKAFQFMNKNNAGYSINGLLQTYDLNKNELNSYGIYTDIDYLNLAEQILVLKYNPSLSIKKYLIDTDNIIKNDDYFVFDINIVYSNDITIKLKAYIAQKIYPTPNIKIVSNYVSEYDQ